LFFGSFGWLSYMALEPYVRRHWPHVLMSWARISAGKFRNPIVGRDILVGMFLGVLLGTLGLTDVCVPYFVNLYGVLPSDAHPEFFGDLRHLLGLFVYLLQTALLLTLATLLLYYVIRMIVRNDRFALAITFVLCVVASLTPGNLYLDLPVTAVQIALLLFAFIRFGFIALLSAEFVLQITVYGLPLTLRPSDWYFARSLTVLSLIVALALWAFRLSTKGKRVFSGLQLED
jgi:serine/threonine-protein kinase